MDENRNDLTKRFSVTSDALDLILIFTKWPLAWRLFVAVLAVALAVAVRYFFLGALEGRLIYLSFYPAVAVAAVIGGVSGGALAALLSAVAAHAQAAPLRMFADLISLISFFVNCVLIVSIAKLLRVALLRIARDESTHRSERELGQFVEQAPAAMAMFDTDMRYLAASARWRDDYQLHRDIVGKSHYEAFPEIPEEWKEIHRRALAGETVRADEDAVTRLDGSAQWLRWEVRPWRHADDGIGGVIIFSEDVSARVEAQEAARRSEQRLRIALAAADAGVWEWDLRSNKNFWSDELWSLYGLEQNIVAPSLDLWRRTVHPDDLDAVARAVNDAMAKGGDISVEWRVANAGGGERWLLSRGGPLYADGMIASYGGVAIDITARKRAEHEALAAKARLEAALQSMTDAVYIVDAEGRFVHVNEAYARFFRFPGKKQCPATLAEFLPILEVRTLDGRDEPPERWPVRMGLRGETATSAEYRLRRKDTGEEWLGSLSYAPIRDENGAIVGSVTTARDITAQRKAEKALHDSEQRFKAVFDTSMDAIAIIDRHGKVLSVNPVLLAQFGYAPEEVIGANVKMLMAAARSAEHDRYIADYLGGGEAKIVGQRRKVEGRRKDGAIFPLELAIARVEDGDLFIGFMRDLTQIEDERRNVEAARAELLHVARLSDMGEVAAGLAHEVSQPLTAILGLAAASRRSLATQAEQTLERSIGMIETQARQAADILRRLRGFIEKRESRRDPESLTRLVQDALSLASLRSGGRPVRIVERLSPDDIDVTVDRVQIMQVLVNFLRNAADAMADHDDAEVVVETELAKPGFVRVKVSDNGPGLDPKVAEKLFTPFVTTKAFGMGVGLSLCRTIVLSHGGDIGCGANVPRGAVFWFTLPVVAREAAESDAPAREPAPGVETEATA